MVRHDAAHPGTPDRFSFPLSILALLAHYFAHCALMICAFLIKDVKCSQVNLQCLRASSVKEQILLRAQRPNSVCFSLAKRSLKDGLRLSRRALSYSNRFTRAIDSSPTTHCRKPSRTSTNWA